MLHQTALATSSVIRVQNALSSGLIKRANRLDSRLTRFFDVAAIDFDTGSLDRGTRAADEKAVPNTLALGTADTLQSRLMVSQEKFLRVQFAGEILADAQPVV